MQSALDCLENTASEGKFDLARVPQAHGTNEMKRFPVTMSALSFASRHLSWRTGVEWQQLHCTGEIGLQPAWREEAKFCDEVCMSLSRSFCG